MSATNFGELLLPGEQPDAIHIAVAPVVAGGLLNPGQHVGFLEEGNTELVGAWRNPIGIVDPYLRQQVKPGQRFWLFLYPNTVTGLRHEWTHPAFEAAAEERVQIAKDLLDDRTPTKKRWEEIASDAQLTVKQLNAYVEDFLENGTYANEGDKWDGYEMPDDLWDVYERLVREEVPEDKKHSFFSCAC